MIFSSVRSLTLLTVVVVLLFTFVGCAEKESVPTPSVQETPDPNMGENVATYTITRTTGTINLDGKLDEDDWKRAVEGPIDQAVFCESVPLKTTVKFLWDDDYLYAGYYCEDPDAWSTFTEEDSPLYRNDTVALYIDPAGKGKHFIETHFSPNNVKLDIYILNEGVCIKGKERMR